MKYTARFSFGFFMIVISLLISCGQSFQTNNSYIQRLTNRGIVPLSSDNPFIAANAMINKEIERSAELKGFIQLKGAPSAVKVEQGFFSGAYIELYYPGKTEYYTAEDNEGIWLINGPYQMDASLIAEINKQIIFTAGKGKINLPPTPAATPTPLAAFPAVTAALPTQSPTIIPTLPAINTIAPALPSLSAPDTTAGRSPDSTLTLQNIIDKYGESLAETTPRGDIVHYVSFPGETGAMLSRWYTLDKDNLDKIMRINNFSPKKVLTVGDSIVIPAYLVKNKKILNEKALPALEAAVAAGDVK